MQQHFHLELVRFLAHTLSLMPISTEELVVAVQLKILADSSPLLTPLYLLIQLELVISAYGGVLGIKATSSSLPRLPTGLTPILPKLLIIY